MLYFDQPLMVHDRARGAREMSKVVGCTTRHIYYLCEQGRFPYEGDGSSTLCLRRSVYHAWLWAQVQVNANWNVKESTLVEMNLAVRKAAALIEQLRARQLSPHTLEPEQQTCFAEVMESAVLAADRALSFKVG